MVKWAKGNRKNTNHNAPQTDELIESDWKLSFPDTTFCKQVHSKCWSHVEEDVLKVEQNGEQEGAQVVSFLRKLLFPLCYVRK